MNTAVTTRPEPATDERRELALLKAVGLDRVSPEQRELAQHIARRYDLDLMLKHIVMIEGKPYVTRDALLHIAHRSGQLDGIEVTEPILAEGFWRATCAVYRKDMGRPFTYSGRYPERGGNAKFAPEMATKVAESMALRRAFDISAPTQDERWDVETPQEPVAVPQSLAERARALKEAQVVSEAATTARTTDSANAGVRVAEAPANGPEQPGGPVSASVAPGVTPPAPGAADDAIEGEFTEQPAADAKPEQCAATSPYEGNARCRDVAGHEGLHRGSTKESWK